MKIYADNAATTQMSENAVQAMLPYMRQIYGNPSSLYEIGQKAKEALEDARQRAAAVLNCEAREIYFTSGGSEADNQAIISAAKIGEKKGKKHIISTTFEHQAVLHTLKKLEKEGFEIELLDVHSNGVVSAEDVKKAIREDTALVTVMYANNEIGTVQPIREIGALCREKNVLFHTDAVQAIGHVSVDVTRECIDMLSLSAHKFHGPKGVGILYAKKGILLSNLIEGGAQERGKRAGTENLPAIAGFGIAAHMGISRFAENARRIIELRQYFDAKLASDVPEARINFPDGVPHIASVCLPGCRSEVVLRILSDRDVYVSAGSACAKGKRSHVLTACGLPSDVIDCTIRVSFSDLNDEADIDALIEGLAAAYARFHRK